MSTAGGSQFDGCVFENVYALERVRDDVGSRIAGADRRDSTDRQLLTLAASVGLNAVHVADLPLPAPPQRQLELEDLLDQPDPGIAADGGEEPPEE